MNKKINAEKKLEKLMKTDFVGQLEDVIIFQNSDNSYELFNMYHITKNNNNEYIVKMHTTFTTHNFNTLKHAVAWCTFDKRNRIVDSNRIYDLDKKVAGLESTIQGHQKLIKSTKNMDDKLIYLAKLGEEKMKKRQLYDELGRYIATSKSWQNNRFDTKPV
jgi:hypothetical protein